VKRLFQTTFLVALIVSAAIPAYASETDTVMGWKNQIITGANLTQTSYTNWAQGGTNTFAWVLTLDGRFYYNQPEWAFTNTYSFAYGRSKVQNQGNRMLSDKIEVDAMYAYKLSLLVNPYAAINFKSQFDQGFKYDKAGVGTPVSKFMDPGYLTESAGMGFVVNDEVKTRVGAALQQIFTENYSALYADGKTFKQQGGLESVTDISYPFYENMNLASKLELFWPFESPRRVIVRSDNTISARVNALVKVTFNWQIISDPRVQAKTQSRHILAVGISYALL